MALKASGILAASVKIQYLCKMLHGELLRQHDMLSVEVGRTTTTHLNRIIWGLGRYYFPINVLSKQKRVVRHRIIKPRKLKLGRYTACMIEIN